MMSELFEDTLDGGPPNEGGAQTGGTRRIALIEARVWIADLLLYALRQAAPDLTVAVASRIEDVEATRMQVIFYNFANRGCDAQAIDKSLSRLRERFPTFPIVITIDAAGADLESMTLRHGVTRVPASSGFDALVAALKGSAAGARVRPRPLSLVDGATFAVSRDRPGPLGLTAKESRILHLIHEGKANKLIAHELDCSESTVKAHVSNMMRKLRLHNRTQLALVYKGQGAGPLPFQRGPDRTAGAVAGRA